MLVTDPPLAVTSKAVVIPRVRRRRRRGLTDILTRRSVRPMNFHLSKGFSHRDPKEDSPAAERHWGKLFWIKYCETIYFF